MAGDVFEGRTLDAAVNKGLEALGLSRAEAMITILEEGSGGFLGFGSRPFRVRVMRRPGGPPRLDPDEERRRRSGRERRERGGRGDRGRDRESGRSRDRGRERAPGGGQVVAQGGAPQGGGQQGPREEKRGERREEKRGERREEKRGERREEKRDGRREERRDGRREPGEERRVAADTREPRSEPRGERRGDRGGEPPPVPPASEPMAERPLDLQHEEHVLEGAPGMEGEQRRRRRRGRRGGRRRHGGEVVASTVIDAADSPLLPPRMMQPPEELEPMVDEENEREELVLEGASSVSMPEPIDEERPRAEEQQQGRPPRFEVPEPAPREPRREERRERNEAPALSADELAEQSRRITEDMLKAMGFEARISATVDGTHVDVTAEVSRDEELLTGRKGEVRQALQHLLNRVLNRGEGSRYHLQLEINDFWKRREEELRELASSLAAEAVESDSEVVTEYLNAQERRIVHVTLREDARVKTYALGTGMIKRVAIAPADSESGPRPESE
jgi:spoIIIJ-associated protein